MRGIVGAKDAPNSRYSHLLSDIINNYADCEEIETECRSSEEMRAAFVWFNGLDEGRRMRCRVISMDVKALYPSMGWGDIVKAVRNLIENSQMKVENVDWDAVGKYLAVMMTEAEIVAEGLRHVIPRRRQGLRRLRKVTVRYLHQKGNNTKWLPARKPGVRQQKRMLALAVCFGVKTVLSNHTYRMGDLTYLQASGGPIGLELTGAVARPFMMCWDKRYLEQVRKAGIDMELYKRYIDDSNQLAVVPPPGSRYDPVRRRVVQDDIAVLDEDEEERLTRILKEIANTIQDGIVMEEDNPGRHEDKKLPILDMAVWTDDQGYLLYQHYEKEMSTKLVLSAHSAQSSSCKRNVHVQETLRRILNCSPRLNWQEQVAPILTDYMARMKDAGYAEMYR